MINFIPPGKLNGSLYGPYYGGGPSYEPMSTEDMMAIQNQAAQAQAALQAEQNQFQREMQREREAFAVAQRESQTQIAMMEESIQEAMEGILTGEIEAQEEEAEGGKLNLDFTASLLDAMQNYAGAGVPMPGTGGGLTPGTPTTPSPMMGGGGAPMGRPV